MILNKKSHKCYISSFLVADMIKRRYQNGVVSHSCIRASHAVAMLSHQYTPHASPQLKAIENMTICSHQKPHLNQVIQDNFLSAQENTAALLAILVAFLSAWSFLLSGTFFSPGSKLNKKNCSLDPHNVGECISNFSVSISISFPTSAVVFSFLLGGNLNLRRGLVEGVDISNGNSGVVALEFFTSSFFCPSDTESLSSSSWYSHCSCWFLFAILEIAECYQKSCHY